MSADTQLVPADAGDLLVQVRDQIRRESLAPRAEELDLLETLAREQAETRAEIAALREEVRRLRDIASGIPGNRE